MKKVKNKINTYGRADGIEKADIPDFFARLVKAFSIGLSFIDSKPSIIVGVHFILFLHRLL